ncbi:hypothetical protein [Thermoflavimicrobium dichotomicum]|nr:hypothetical protein [Thermoflavimicrobium dichotomicum]
MEQDIMDEAYQQIKKIEVDYRLVVQVLQGSHIFNQLPLLEKYDMDVEVCVPVYLRERNVWKNGIVETKGSLKAEPLL